MRSLQSIGLEVVPTSCRGASIWYPGTGHLLPLAKSTIFERFYLLLLWTTQGSQIQTGIPYLSKYPDQFTKEVVGDHVVEEPSDHKDIGLRGFDFNIFNEDEEGVVREECSGTYLKMLIKLRPGGYWIDQLKRMNQKVDEENGKQLV